MLVQGWKWGQMGVDYLQLILTCESICNIYILYDWHKFHLIKILFGIYAAEFIQVYIKHNGKLNLGVVP